MQTVNTFEALGAAVKMWRESEQRIALVPTMGNLHDGHLKLIEIARRIADRVVASIFVNPAQFAENEDIDNYPRTIEKDSKLLYENQTDLLFAPSVDQIYPPGCKTFVEVAELSNILCGEFRPTHFRGVTTIVCKLLNIARPDIAMFGEKDFQQLVVIRNMVADLNIPVDIMSVPIVREDDGLAFSSRNAYLSPRERKQAGKLYRLLKEARDSIDKGRRDFRQIEIQQLELVQQAGFRPEYFSIRRTDNLILAGATDKDLVILTAAWLGKARLIDNIQLSLK